ncbi:type II toxin-antitoxin system RelE/ParE family toxin [Reichenbachiella ulvae]|uniref:Type II toxin-antitoxin system RelE/ParE family toxin n=1 Tax=Reichenbachiella ulvae TaxID=2980104 RepID=A0ABT3CZW0_9BACT|nr:type II toxin-antitoxin system RelE/ParE family toxin [Reichenbachiella ulvae]MCV9389231.1 type II toxin-antitoxin system RelE/ParE family toxin [Reichenbachiella ulvae]
MPNHRLSIKWTPFALGCLDEIYEYISFREKSSSPAIKLVDDIFKRVNQLLDFPESGQIEPLLLEIGQESRYLIIASYKLIYEYHSDSNFIIITDVFHTSQDPKKLEDRKK